MPPYERTRRARSALNLGALLFGLAFAAFAASYGADWWFFIPLGLFILPLAVTLIRGRDALFRIDDDAISWDEGGKRRQVAIAEIDHLRIEDWTDSTDIYVVRPDGTRQKIPAVCNTGPRAALLAAAQARGIRTEIH